MVGNGGGENAKGVGVLVVWGVGLVGTFDLMLGGDPLGKRDRLSEAGEEIPR